MLSFDLCLAWNWEYDADFVHLLEAACAARRVSFRQITPETLEQALAGLSNEETGFSVYFDRASESDLRFQPLADWADSHGVFRINSHSQAPWLEDKATMQAEFIRRGLNTPYTVILPSYEEQAEIPLADLDPFRESFTIKPARGGGGEGVVLEASSWEQVLAARRQFPAEKYLLQAYVATRLLAGRPAWFRVLYCDGAVYACWWDPATHIYTWVTAEERAQFGLRILYEVPRRIAQICRLHLFSTEIALSKDGQFLVVDYINDPLDLRLQSKASDGVPDAIVENIARRLAMIVDRNKSQKQPG